MNAKGAETCFDHGCELPCGHCERKKRKYSKEQVKPIVEALKKIKKASEERKLDTVELEFFIEETVDAALSKWRKVEGE